MDGSELATYPLLLTTDHRKPVALEPGITSVPVQMDGPGLKLTQPRSTTAGHRVQLDQVPALRILEGKFH